MQYIYTQLNQANICIGVSYLAGKVIQDNLIDVSSHADPHSLLGQAYDRDADTFYTLAPQPLPPVPLTEEEQYRYQAIINQEYLIALEEINAL